MPNEKTYAASGVDVSNDDDFSGIMAKHSRATHKNIPYSIRDNIVKIRPDLDIVQATDGIGTNITDAERVNDHSTMASKMISMVLDDIAIIGAEPITIANYLAVNNMTHELAKQLGASLETYAKKAGVAVVAGESANIPSMIKNEYDWAGFGIGLLHPEREITKKNVAVGDFVFSLNANNLRSNGYTLVHDILDDAFGNNWHNQPYNDAITWGNKLIEEADIFTPLIVEMTGGYDRPRKVDISAMANVTGGGPLKRLGELVNVTGLSVYVDDAPPVPEEMIKLQELGPVTDIEAYKTWNMGFGVVGTVKTEEETKTVIEIADKLGYTAQIVGTITSEETPTVTILSNGYHSAKEELAYHLRA
ncbi:MAG: hypothetical protein KAT91_00030 [Candidatus Aenigmarchaeota archaeon]|nr:hypothetical protein [Candidatus Aenigmarchaeota archaeon]